MSEARELPRGRHSLSREQVSRSQRERILRSIVEVSAERGYAAATVADVLERAGISRKTFYEQFTSKADCFMTAFEEGARIVVGPAIAQDPGSGPPLERFSAGLRLYLEGMAAHPAYARMFMVEVHAAAPEVARRRAALLDAYVEVVNEIFGAESAEDRFAGRALVAAISSLVTVALMDGDVEGVCALHAPLVAVAARLFSAPG